MLHIDEILNYAELSEMIFNAKEEVMYAYLLEGFNFPSVSELWFAARNEE
jgi:hypothetical protein